MLAVPGDLVSIIASDTRQEEPGSVAVGVRRGSRDGGSLPAMVLISLTCGSISPEPGGLCTAPDLRPLGLHHARAGGFGQDAPDAVLGRMRLSRHTGIHSWML